MILEIVSVIPVPSFSCRQDIVAFTSSFRASAGTKALKRAGAESVILFERAGFLTGGVSYV
jgi:hypothetical protein